MTPFIDHQQIMTRRSLFGKAAMGLGGLALGSMFQNDALALPPDPHAPILPHFAPKAKRVIYLFQNGAPSHVDLFDHKPMLKKWHGKQIPDSVAKGKRFSTMSKASTPRPVLSEISNFKQHGKSGAWVSDFMPKTAEIADDLCFVKSLHTESVNHAPAITYLLTGGEMAGRPSFGSWLSYGLGSESENIPSFVVMTSRDKEASCGQIFYDYYWGSGFLPTKYQGVKFRGNGDPVLYISNPDGLPRDVRRGMLDDLARLNEKKLQEVGDPEISTRISQYEMAYRMQSSVPELTDFSDEPQHILDMYGPDVKRQGSYAYNCLMARRLIEKGSRFVQLMHAGWDQHNNLNHQLKIQCNDTDAASAALVKDLKQRGLLEDTLVIWGGEFGRTPFLQGKIEDTKRWGRDHHPYTFTKWMAGGGVKPGISYGQSDEFGFNAVKDKVHVHDFQATIMHLLGIDHEKFTFRHQGRQFRLTDVHGHVVKDILA
ncbi:MAG: DUF1501 domain-containing protein [Lentisphaeraceae bacterium]|nr:DUF1501 domain-containing protein [Lentisphaeraceae bacterium]